MTSDIGSVRRALQRSRGLFKEIDQQYTSFLADLRAMKAPLQELGVSFDLTDDQDPASLVLTTPVGLIHMDRVMFVDGQYVAYAVVFSESVSAGVVPRGADLWSLQLRWEHPWRHGDGNEVRRDFVTDDADPKAPFDAIANAIAAKLVLNNERVSLA